MAFTTVTFAWDIVSRRNVPPLHSALERCQEGPSLLDSFCRFFPITVWGQRFMSHINHHKGCIWAPASVTVPARRHSLTFHLAGWRCSHSPDSAGKKRWLQSMASHLPSGPDLGLLTPGCMDKQTERGPGKQTMLSGLCMPPTPLDIISFAATATGRRDLLRQEHTCQRLLFMKMPPCRAPTSLSPFTAFKTS